MLWQRLYGNVWLAFFACVLIPRWMGVVGAPVHVLLGIALLVMAMRNARELATLSVPARLHRISRATANIALIQAIGGVIFGGVKHMLPHVPVLTPLFQGIHVVCALAILAQVASVATSHDIWLTKEYETGK